MWNIYPLNQVNWKPGRQAAYFPIIFLFESKMLNVVTSLIPGTFFYLYLSLILMTSIYWAFITTKQCPSVLRVFSCSTHKPVLVSYDLYFHFIDVEMKAWLAKKFVYELPACTQKRCISNLGFLMEGSAILNGSKSRKRNGLRKSW